MSDLNTLKNLYVYQAALPVLIQVWKIPKCLKNLSIKLNVINIIAFVQKS